MHQIELEHINKTFHISQRPEGRFGILRGAFYRKKKTVEALTDLSFSIDRGELVGYIGPNGAGKSTTVKVMSGILYPDSGSCRIMGRVPWKERTAHVAKIGVVFGQRSQLWWDVPVSDTFDLLREIYSILNDRFKKRQTELVDTLGIAGFLNTPVRQLSLGQRMRCEIAASLLHSPEILFLDEPTIGLDAVSKLALRDFLKEENRNNGVTMILTTHDTADIEALCSRVMVIGRGRLLFDGGLDTLKTRFSPMRRIRATVKERVGDYSFPGAEKIETEGNSITVWFDPQKIVAYSIVSHMANTLPLSDIMIEEQDIDEIIAEMYREMKI